MRDHLERACKVPPNTRKHHPNHQKHMKRRMAHCLSYGEKFPVRSLLNDRLTTVSAFGHNSLVFNTT